MSEIPGIEPISHRPIIFVNAIPDLDRLGGVVSHETTEVAIHLTFDGIRTMREVMDAITRMGIRDEDRAFVALPASWSLYVSTAALDFLADHGGYRIEGR